MRSKYICRNWTLHFKHVDETSTYHLLTIVIPPMTLIHSEIEIIITVAQHECLCLHYSSLFTLKQIALYFFLLNPHSHSINGLSKYQHMLLNWRTNKRKQYDMYIFCLYFFRFPNKYIGYVRVTPSMTYVFILQHPLAE